MGGREAEREGGREGERGREREGEGGVGGGGGGGGRRTLKPKASRLDVMRSYVKGRI